METEQFATGEFAMNLQGLKYAVVKWDWLQRCVKTQCICCKHDFAINSNHGNG